MKLMIASDLHGSAFYCDQLINAFHREQPDRLLLLGDLLYHGPRNDLPKDYDPKKVIKMLNGIKENLLCVVGNCDAEVDQMVLEFPIQAEYCIIPLNNRIIFATHGHKFHPANPPMLKKEDILLNGHTHVPSFEKYDTFIYLNPGSVSLPKEGSRHSYLVIEDRIIFKNLEGEVYREEAFDNL